MTDRSPGRGAAAPADGPCSATPSDRVKAAPAARPTPPAAPTDAWPDPPDPEAPAAPARARREAPPPAPDARPVGEDLAPLFETAWRRATGEERPLATPWPTVNAVLGDGLWPGLYVLVGGTGAGKTQWALQVALAVAQAGTPALYVALELGRQELAARVVGLVADVAWSDLLRGRLTTTRLADLAGPAERALRALPLYTECGPPYGYDATALAAAAHALRPGLVVLDYLQLCAGGAGDDPRVAVGRVAYVARALARDRGAVVLVLSSTARAHYPALVWTDDRDPRDFVGFGKESGEIEYAADGVLVLAHAPEPASTARTLVVAKHRAGPTGAAALRWSGTRFTAPEADPPSPNPREDATW
jgi:replicative DNA helicase